MSDCIGLRVLVLFIPTATVPTVHICAVSFFSYANVARIATKSVMVDVMFVFVGTSTQQSHT